MTTKGTKSLIINLPHQIKDGRIMGNNDERVTCAFSKLGTHAKITSIYPRRTSYKAC